MWAFTAPASWLASCAAALACNCAMCSTREALKSSARVAYVVLFTFSLLLSWLLRDFAKPLLQKIPCECRALGAAGEGRSGPDRSSPR